MSLQHYEEDGKNLILSIESRTFCTCDHWIDHHFNGKCKYCICNFYHFGKFRRLNQQELDSNKY